MVKFTYRGKNLDDLIKMSDAEFFDAVQECDVYANYYLIGDRDPQLGDILESCV